MFRRSGSPWLRRKPSLPGAILPDSIGHQHLHPPAATGPPHSEANSVQEQVRPFILQRRLMKLAHRLVQIAGQPRHGLRADRLARQGGDDPPHLAGGNPAQERFPHQQRQLVGAPLKWR